MIESYFSRPETIDRLRSGPLGADLDDLATALQDEGYARDSIRHYLRGCDQFGRWVFVAAQEHNHAGSKTSPFSAHTQVRMSFFTINATGLTKLQTLTTVS